MRQGYARRPEHSPPRRPGSRAALADHRGCKHEDTYRGGGCRARRNGRASRTDAARQGDVEPVRRPRRRHPFTGDQKARLRGGTRRHHWMQGEKHQGKGRKGYVAGFTVTNDVSARDIQLAEHEKNPFFRVHYIGKSFDTFCPAGPALVTVDEFTWGKPLKMSTKVNGEIRQNSDTSDLYFGIEALVAYASRSMTLFPGDIIATGSPAGVAYFMNPQRFLQPGDFVCCEIEGVGVIENRVRPEQVS